MTESMSPFVESETPDDSSYTGVLKRFHLFSETENGLRYDEWFTTGGNEMEVKMISTRADPSIYLIKQGVEMELSCEGKF